MTPFEMVRQFHETFGHTVNDSPCLPGRELEALRRTLIYEECEEFLEASMDANVVDIAQELADIIYVVYGAALCYGIDLDAVVAEVHRANMSKLGPNGEVLRREDGKILKSENYSPPNIKGVLGR